MARGRHGGPPRPRSTQVRVTVPPADVSVLQWVGVQENVSFSIRQLIRDSIERDGYVDRINEPVGQLPRRGRPPLAGRSEVPDVAPGSAEPVDSAERAHPGSEGAEGAQQRSVSAEPVVTAPDGKLIPADSRAADGIMGMLGLLS